MKVPESKKLKAPFKVAATLRYQLIFTVLFCLVLGVVQSIASGMQQNQVSGTVKDETGVPLEGVSITIKGQSAGVSTDVSGNFSIPASENDVLVISFLGFKTTEIVVSDTADYEVVMAPDLAQLDEVVVVGYGVKKKINLTGAVSSITSADLLKRPTQNLSNMLQGKMAGLQVTQGTGQPGKENTSISIRGQGSYGASSAPLILIDGVIGNMANVNPQDVESISVLKDAASAAIYGARAANGVILVTTKRGKAGEKTISYTNSFAVNEATRLPDLIWNSAETMELWNSAVAHTQNAQPTYTQEEIDAYRNGESPFYPNYNWIDNTFKKGFVQNHYLSLNGGGDNTTYHASLGYLDQEGILPGHDHQRYSANMSLSSDIADWISFGSNIALTQREFTEPWLQNDAYVLLIYSQTGLSMPYLPDGSARYSARAYDKVWQNRNPIAVAQEGGRERTDYSIRGQANIDITPVKDLVWSTKVAFNLDESHDKRRAYGVDTWYYQKMNPGDADYTYANNLWPNIDNGVIVDNYRTRLYTLYSTLNYSKVINSHDFSILGGYSQEYQRWDQLGASRIGIISNDLDEINAGSPEGQSTRGTANEWAIQSLFGRIHYNYEGKYLFEANLRYDGTSRIHKDNRWGLFPSFSAGWRLSQESFMQNATWLDQLKLRVSYGKLGNQEIGNYPYQDILQQANYAFGSNIVPGIYVTRLTDKSLRWEATEVFNLGVDYSMLNGLFAFSLDLYRKNTVDILYTQPIPASVGLSAPTVNFGAMENTGLDLELSHRNRIGEVSYGLNAVFATYRNEVTKLLSPSIGSFTISKEGAPWGAYYMYEWIGVFQTDEEVSNSPQQPFNPKPGDLKFKDQDGNGSVGPEDRKIIDGAHPDFTYSLGLNMEYRNFDFSAFFQGVEGRKLYVTGWGIEPFGQGGAPPAKWRDAWTPENPTNSLPHIYVSGNGDYSPVNGNASTFFLQDASYLRLKNVNIGYTFTPEILDKLSLKSLRIFFSGDNLLTFTQYEGADPERAGSGRFAQFPQLRVYSMGLSVKL